MTRFHTTVFALLVVLLFSPSFAQDISNPQANQSALTQNKGQLPGTATNDNASTGNVGEYIESAIASPGVSLTTTSAANVTSISLTAGDWDIVLNGSFLTGVATSITQTLISISSTSATVDASPGKFSALNFTPTVFGAVNQSSVLQSFRVSLTSTTTIYFVARSTFTVSTVSVWGLISARRRR